MSELDGFMNGDPTVRAEFLSRITKGSTPAFKQTYAGDPKRMQALKATLPNISTALKVSHANDLFNPYAMGLNVRQMRTDLLDIEMGLCGGG